MKLNNEPIWITGKFDLGEIISELGNESVYNHIQAIGYYKDGISEIDNHFRPSDYIDKGYVFDIITTEFGLAFGFSKYKASNVVDYTYAYIERSKILNFEEHPTTNLKVVKKEDNKHYRKNLGRKAFAGASVLIGAVADQFTVVNTELITGVEYKLYYQSKFGEKEHLTIYASDEHKNNVTLFLNTFFKKELPEEAKKPFEQEKSTCFIATACYRDMFSEEVIFFRWYRDNKLDKSIIGKLFIKTYYKISPSFYDLLFNNQILSKKVKFVLDKIYLRLK